MPPSSASNSRRRRGQTLVLFAFTLILLALAVTLTLSFTTRVKQKIEAQTVADEAAYSNAIVTARTYNAIGLLNRAQIAHMVAQAGASSLINFSSFYWAHLYNLFIEYYTNFQAYAGDCDKWIPTLTQPCSCQAEGDLGIQMAWLGLEETRLLAGWNKYDKNAAKQARQRWDAGVVLYLQEEILYQKILRPKLNSQKLAQLVANQANNAYPSAQLSAPSGGDLITQREVAGGVQCLGSGATCDVNAVPAFNGHAVTAAMAARGWRFVTGGVNGDDIITQKLRWLVSPQRPAAVPLMPWPLNATGSAYWSAPLPIIGWHSRMPLSTYNEADNHGLTVNSYDPHKMAPIWVWKPGPLGFPMPRGAGPLISPICFGAQGPPKLPATSTLIGSNAMMSMFYTTQHIWLPGTGDLVNNNHNTSIAPWPGVWPPFVDYSYTKVANKDDNWGQPKNMALIQRDLTGGDPNSKPDPWNLFFNFRFTPTGEDFDNRGFKTQGGIDLSKQTVIATGQTYYHRATNWQEVPTLLNPFWRATLVPADVDLQGQTDPEQLLNNVGNAPAADVYRELRNAGYKGIH